MNAPIKGATPGVVRAIRNRAKDRHFLAAIDELRGHADDQDTVKMAHHCHAIVDVAERIAFPCGSCGNPLTDAEWSELMRDGQRTEACCRHCAHQKRVDL